ncbi:hypothetical protein WJU23_12765 [Prosthecobacter sp. SYSU 5D2]|uniref:hypothetical protein n=1 Tax=Prosthecobacter sp. SYSU 5D2 TaxID=3134134 RepID=UPI0031FED646
MPHIHHLFLCAFLALSVSQITAGPAEEARLLSRESYKLEAEMRKLVPDIEDRVPELKVLTEQAKETDRKIYEALKTHPALADMRAKRDQAFTQLTHTIGKGDPAAHQAAKDAYAQAEQDVKTQGRTVPEIQAMMDEAANLGASYMAKKDAAYARQPETAELAKKVAELRAKAAALRREARTSTKG